MRGKLAKFLVTDNVFDTISKCANTTVPYMMAEGFDNDIGQMDFIIFYNTNHEEQLKLYWASNERNYIKFIMSRRNWQESNPSICTFPQCTF